MFEQYHDVLTVEEIAEALQVSKSLVRKLIKDNAIQAFKIGREYRVSKESLIKYVRESN